MDITEKKSFVTADEIKDELHVSKATAYSIIRRLNDSLQREHPSALIIPGKVNRRWYEEACLKVRN